MAGYPGYSSENMAAREAVKQVDRNTPEFKRVVSDIARKILDRHSRGFLGNAGEYSKQFAHTYGEELTTTLPTTLRRAGAYTVYPLSFIESLYGGTAYTRMIEDVLKNNQYGNENDKYISNEMQAARAALGDIGARSLGAAVGAQGLSSVGQVLGGVRAAAPLALAGNSASTAIGPIGTAAVIAPDVLDNRYASELTARNLGFNNADDMIEKQKLEQEARDTVIRKAQDEASKWVYNPYVGYGAGAGVGALGGWGLGTLLKLKTPGKVLSTIGGGVAGSILGRYIQDKAFKAKVNEFVRKFAPR